MVACRQIPVATGEREGSAEAAAARGGGGEGKGYTSERIVDSEAAGWPGTEPRDWIPEMRQTDGTPEPSSPLAPPCPPDGGG